MQGGAFHGRAGDEHGLHDAVGGHAAGASHVHADVQQLGVHLFGRVLVRHRPARHAGGVAQLSLGREVVDLNDDAVNFVHEGVALLAVLVNEVEHRLGAIGDFAVGAHGQTPGGEQVVSLVLGGNIQAGARTDAVYVHAQRARCGHRRILLAQRACRGVTRVREGVLAGGDHGLVELLKIGGGDEHFAADLYLFGVVISGQLLRDARNGAHIVGDIFAGGTVAAGCRAYEGAVAVEQVYRQAVNFQLGQPLRCATGEVADALLGLGQPGAQLLEGEDVLEGVHALQVGDGRESFDGFAADFLGGRVVGDQVRVLRLNNFEAAVERIVLGVGEEGRVLVVVGSAGGTNLIGQFRVLGTQGLGNFRGVFCDVFCGALCSSLGGGSLLGGVVLSHPSSLAFLLHLSPISRHIAGFCRRMFTASTLSNTDFGYSSPPPPAGTRTSTRENGGES